MIVGITGSFGSGKSIVARLFATHGFRVINVDSLYHHIYQKDRSLQKKILREFNTLDRNSIKTVVFNDSRRLRRLNAITHPYILRELKKKMRQIRRKQKDANIAVDIPLLFESKQEKMFDHIIVVKASRKRQLRNILKKGKKYTSQEIARIIASQMPLAEKIRRADFVVDNSKDRRSLGNQIFSIVEKLSE